MPLFVTGTMRSGTTWLINKITQHPQLLKVGSELNEVWTEIGGARCLDDCEYRNETNADYSYAFQMGSYFHRFIRESKSFKRHAMRALNVKNMQEGRVFYDWGNIIPVNKSTHLMNKLQYVHTLFPESKIVLIIRDIYGQSSSLKFHFEDIYKRTGKVYVSPDDKKACWSRLNSGDVQDKHSAYPGNFSTIPEMWIRLNALALKELSELDNIKYFVVDYNEMVSHQELVLEKVFEFLNLEPKHHKKAMAISKSVSSFRNTTTAGNPLDKWKKHLTEAEKNAIVTAIKNNKPDYEFILNSLAQYRIHS